MDANQNEFSTVWTNLDPCSTSRSYIFNGTDIGLTSIQQSPELGTCYILADLRKNVEEESDKLYGYLNILFTVPTFFAYFR